MRKKLLAMLLFIAVLPVLSACSAPAAEMTEYEYNTAGNTPFNIMCGGRLACQGGAVYYYEPASVWNYGGGLFRAGEDGTGKSRLATGEIESVNALGETVWFVRRSAGEALGTLCSVPAVGGHVEEVASGCRSALVLGEAAYYIGAGDGLYRLDLASGQAREIVSSPVLDYSVDGGFAYCHLRDGIQRLEESGGTLVTLVQGASDAFSAQDGLVYYSVYDAATGSNAITVLDDKGSKSGFSFSGSRVTRLSPYRNAIFFYTDKNELIRVGPDGSDPVYYGGGRAADPCFFADRAYAWSREKPVALLDKAEVGFETTDVYASAGSIQGPTALLIRSADELTAAMDKYGMVSLSGETLEEKYNEAFFHEKALILALARVRAGSLWSVSGVTFSGVRTMKDGNLALDVAMDAETAGTADDADCGGCLVEVAKADMDCAAKAAVTVNDVGEGAVG